MTTALQYGSKPVGGYDHLPTLPAYRASNNPPLRATATVRRVPVAAPSSSLRQSHGHSTTHVTSHSPSHQQHHHSPTRRVHPPHHQRSDHLILTRRRNEEARLRQEEQIHYYDRTAQQAHFEEDTSDQIKRKKVLDRFQQLKLHEDAKLDARKDRLRDLLERDEDLWRQELAAAEPTKESRVQAMRDRMTELKQKREAERLALVEEKLLQRWRNECDELRAVESRILETEVANARAGQLVEHQEKVALAAQEKRYYDHLWEQDRLRKIEREEKDRTHQRELNEATTATLKEQLYMLQMKAQEEQRLKQEEAALMRQDLELQKLTEERVHQQKLASQRLIRLDLDAFNKSKVQARQREVQDALELDLKVVNAFFRMDEMEKETKSRRKEQLKLEMRMYMDHLKHQQEIERENAKEIDRLYAEESTKVRVLA
ncbi:Cilia- and flagella-associated protein 53 [Thoreauomyces humboldtii]|nr:Cilia- and flagella-associated protein 53 [Thoreauomyces humboldtii]